MAEVTKQLDGLGVGEQPESYSGFITVDKSHNSNMFFWFFPATVSNLQNPKSKAHVIIRFLALVFVSEFVIIFRMSILPKLQLLFGFKVVQEGHLYLVY